MVRQKMVSMNTQQNSGAVPGRAPSSWTQCRRSLRPDKPCSSGSLLTNKEQTIRSGLEGAIVPGVLIDPVAKDYQDVFEGLALLSSQRYKITLKPDAVPQAVTTPRRIPLPYHNKVKREVERMQALGVIEAVTHPMEWVSPIAVVRKQNGAGRC